MPLAIPWISPKLLDSIAGYYPQTVTIQRVTLGTADEYGVQDETWDDLAGHIDIAARVISNGPGTGAGGWSGEVQAPNGTYAIEGLTMALRGYYPNIVPEDRVVYNSTVYDILAAESDASGITTRLRVREVD